ncbi:MAG TPA: class II aldolase/adducin family protein [Nitrospiraceae bacterium]|nr:class II aldolase/adducin family protein [Nitrospiraceae bacterium]
MQTRNPDLVENLVAANRILAQQGILDGFGHVSVRHDSDPNRYLLSRSIAPELITSADIMEFDLDSNPIDAKGRGLYLERFIHGEIYKARPDVTAIVHNHSPALIPFGVAPMPLRPLYHLTAFVGEGIPVFDIRDAAGATDMLVSDSAKGRALVQTLQDKPGVLMRGHGASVVGPSIQVAVGRSIYLELDARLQMQVLPFGDKVRYLSSEEVKLLMVNETARYDRPWQMWKRKAMGG